MLKIIKYDINNSYALLLSVLPVNLVAELDELKPDVHEALVGRLVLRRLLGQERRVLQVRVHVVHLDNLNTRFSQSRIQTRDRSWFWNSDSDQV